MAEVNEPKTFKDIIANQPTDALVALARLTEQAERYEDMCVIMGNIVKKNKAENKPDLSVEQRNMLSVAYKNVVGSRRASWRALKEHFEKPEQNQDSEYKADYQATLEAELFEKCNEVLNLLKENLLMDEDARKDLKAQAEASGAQEQTEGDNPLETQVFYLKMSGDYYRYLAEFKDGDEHKEKAAKQYKTALDLAEQLPPTHPTRLGLALNASVCYWEILKNPTEACNLAKKAFDEAIQKLDSLSDNTYKDSTLIMQLLRDNLTIWTNDPQNNNAAEDPEAEA